MTDIIALIISPFSEFAFMRRALMGCILLSLGAAPLGVMLILRRMSLMGEAMAHAVLPGVAAGFLIGGLSVPIMGLGGLVAGIIVTLLVGVVTRTTILREDANLAAFYLIALALGVMLISLHGSSVDLVHLLFGSVLAIDRDSLLLMASITSITLLLFALLYRPILTEAFDPIFMRSVNRLGSVYHLLFLVLVVINLIAGFQALGTLMSVGLMMLPAAAARFWAKHFLSLSICAAIIGILSGAIGLLISYHINVPSGPAIILVAGTVYIISLLVGSYGSVRARYYPAKHLAN
jgi:zinc/manganese transport system permease protein